jgi:hypothetical protein
MLGKMRADIGVCSYLVGNIEKTETIHVAAVGEL